MSVLKCEKEWLFWVIFLILYAFLCFTLVNIFEKCIKN